MSVPTFSFLLALCMTTLVFLEDVPAPDGGADGLTGDAHFDVELERVIQGAVATEAALWTAAPHLVDCASLPTKQRMLRLELGSSLEAEQLDAMAGAEALRVSVAGPHGRVTLLDAVVAGIGATDDGARHTMRVTYGACASG